MHKHSVYDVDSHYRIDPTSRKIVNESSGKLNLMQYDHNSERFTFDITKEVEGHNMMDCNVVEIHYLNVDSTSDTVVEGVYDVTDMQLSPEDDNVVIFSWLISANATQFVGLLQFLIRFACVADDGTIEYAWHTDIYEKIKISKGINNTDSVYMQYADVLHQWKQEISNIVNGGTGGSGGTGGNGSGADGYSPTVDITDVENGHRVTVTDVNGTKSFDVMDGAKGDKGETGERGERGVSILNVQQIQTSTSSGGTNTIAVNTTDGERYTFTVQNGAMGEKGETGNTGAKGDKGDTGSKGDKGERGVAGIVISDTEPLPDSDGNHPVWINPNGEDSGSYVPEKGVDYWTEEDKAEIVQELLSQVVDGNEVSY